MDVTSSGPSRASERPWIPAPLSGITHHSRTHVVADKMMQTAAAFLNDVVKPNLTMLRDDVSSYPAAINAILTVDAFFGIYFSQSKQIHHSNDTEFRQYYAGLSDAYRIVRDCSFAIKHGVLTGKVPRLVRRSDQIVRNPLRIHNDNSYDGESIFSDDVITIELEQDRIYVESVIREVVRLMECIVTGEDFIQKSLREIGAFA